MAQLLKTLQQCTAEENVIIITIISVLAIIWSLEQCFFQTCDHFCIRLHFTLASENISTLIVL